MKAIFFGAFVVLLCLLTVVTLIVGDGSIALAVVPVLLMGLIYAVWRLPLRYPTLALTFLALVLENPSDVPAMGMWKSPLYSLGAMLLAHLNLTFPTQKWLFFSGLDLVLVYLFGIAIYRWATRSKIEGTGSIESAPPMRLFAAVSLGGALFMWLWGVVRGGADVPSSLWQMQRVVYLPLFYFLFQLTLRGAADRAALAKVIVVAACLKAALAIYIRATLPPKPPATVLDYATTHADSMLFACAVCIMVALLMERIDRKNTVRAIFVLPLILAGMWANHRRVVWVELGAGLVTLFALSPPHKAKRAIARAALILSPFVLFYLVIGWGSSSSVFGPVQTIRSVVDSKADPSTAWRDWENYNLFYTLRQSPVLGTGYGHGYIEIVKLPDISQAYGLYRFIPHNSILGLWAYGGLVGFFSLWAMIIVGVFLAIRACKHASLNADRAAALSAISAIVIYLMHCYGDMGLGTWTSVFTVAPAFAIASQLAVATGGWPSAVRSAPSEAPVVIKIHPVAPPLPELPSRVEASS